jgi:hypothetical protein
MVALIVFPASTRADDWNRLTTTVFDRPVEIPGQVLAPGVYVFKLAEISGEHNVVQVWNADQTVLYATIKGVPQHISASPKESLFIFEHRGKNEPAKLVSWFYEGDSWGKRFIYPENSAKAQQ